MPTPKLKPCPFCPDGGKPFTDSYVHGWEIFAKVGCNECGVAFESSGLTDWGRDARADANALLPPIVEKWNRRAPVNNDAPAIACPECGSTLVMPFDDGTRWCDECGHEWKETPVKHEPEQEGGEK